MNLAITPKVSIVTPCYNRERYLGLAIQSVLNQTYTDFELIVVDDGSTDASLQIAEGFTAADDRIKVLALSRNQGVAFALKAGFAVAEGEFIGQVDSDDLLEPQALELTVQSLEDDRGLGMVYTNYLDIDAGGNKLRVGSRCSTPYSKQRLLSHFMTFHFRLIRKATYLEAGGINTKYKTNEDYDLCLRISEISRINKLNDFLYLYRVHGNSLSSTNSLQMLGFSCRAINDALERRGMSATHELVIRNPQFEIVEKQGIEYFKNQYHPPYPPPE